MSPLLALIFKTSASLLLWPVAASMFWVLARQSAGLPWSEPRLVAFSSGFGVYLLVQVFFWKPLFFYVMGHELTHALAAVLQGGRADDLQVSSSGGRVKVSVSNFLVALAPYFFPLYTFIVLPIYWISDPRYHLYILFVLGGTLAFHFALTFYSLREHQSDIEQVGWLFAFPFIAISNLLVLALLLSVSAPATFSLKIYLLSCGETMAQLSRWVVSLF